MPDENIDFLDRRDIELIVRALRGEGVTAEVNECEALLTRFTSWSEVGFKRIYAADPSGVPAPEPTALLIVILEGGLVQTIVSTDPRAVTAAIYDIVVVDYDTDGLGRDEIGAVEQADGTFTEAHVSHRGVEQATIGRVFDREELEEHEGTDKAEPAET
jgi:hypothetical protein